MALNNPKPVQSWCVILQTFSKKNRKELVSELVKGFGLDEQEASDSIANLPIVLVDLLNLNQAKAVKEKLDVVGAVIEITNHDIIKKQCYRIEWPSQPDLSYFEAGKTSAAQPVIPSPISPVSPKLPATESLNSLPSKNEPSPSPFAPKASIPASPAKPKSLTPLPTSFPKPSQPVEKNYDAEPKAKKSWFPFGNKKQPALPVKPDASRMAKPVLLKTQTKTDDASTYQSKAKPADLNQNDWQKRTQEIQSRLEKMGAAVPESIVKPVKSVDVQPDAPIVKQDSEDLKKNSHESIVVAASKKEVPVSELPVATYEPSDAIKKNDSLVNQSTDLLEKIQKLESELLEKKKTLELKHQQIEEVQKHGEDVSQKVQQLEKILLEKESHLSAHQAELEKKHQQVEEVQKVGATFSEKVVQLEKALSEKETHLSEKHSLLEQKSEKERALSEAVANLETRLAEKSAELETRKQEVLQMHAQHEEVLKTKDHELELIQARMLEIAQKFQSLEQSLYEKQDAIAHKDSEIQAKDQKIQSLLARVTELEKKLQDAQSLEKDKEQQIANAQAREKESDKKAESLEKTLVEMGESLVQRDESLRQRDEVLVALERRVQDLAEKTGNYETLKASYSKLLEESEEVTGKYARLSEEHRRLRSKNERKTATLTREMGEWVRKVDHLRQGLQKFNQNIVRPEFSEEAESDSDTPPTA